MCIMQDNSGAGKRVHKNKDLHSLLNVEFVT